MCFPPTHSYTRDVLFKGDIASATKTDKKMINNAVTKQKYDQIYETIVWKGGGGVSMEYFLSIFYICWLRWHFKR